MNLKALQWNCRNVSSKFTEIKALLSGVSLFCLNEVGDVTADDLETEFPGFTCYYLPGSKQRGGGLIVGIAVDIEHEVKGQLALSIPWVALLLVFIWLLLM